VSALSFGTCAPVIPSRFQERSKQWEIAAPTEFLNFFYLEPAKRYKRSYLIKNGANGTLTKCILHPRGEETPDYIT
jgi:hypothetical protein